MSTIVLAGGTGNLGGRIAKALRARGAKVVALVREESKKEKRDALATLGVDVAVVDPTSTDSVAKACAGAACIVSAVQGLRDVIVDTQTVLFESAQAAGVPRFIPSDYATDFRDLPPGDNRNFDLRRELDERLDASSLASTSIFNGAFAEILGYGSPLLDLKGHTVGYWEDASWTLDFTTMDDVAAYTAAAALDPKTPRALHIASFQVTPKELAALASEVFGTPFTLVDKGTRASLAAYNEKERAAHPEGETEVFPPWQRSQYIQSMFATHHASLDNARYSDVTWTSAKAFLSGLARRG